MDDVLYRVCGCGCTCRISIHAANYTRIFTPLNKRSALVSRII